jgi:hypothetical protein
MALGKECGNKRLEYKDVAKQISFPHAECDAGKEGCSEQLIKLPKTVAYRLSEGLDIMKFIDYDYNDDDFTEFFDAVNAAGGYEMCLPDNFPSQMAVIGTYV